MNTKKQPAKVPNWKRQLRLHEKYLESLYKVSDKDWQNTIRIIRLDGYVGCKRIGQEEENGCANGK